MRLMRSTNISCSYKEARAEQETAHFAAERVAQVIPSPAPLEEQLAPQFYRSHWPDSAPSRPDQTQAHGLAAAADTPSSCTQTHKPAETPRQLSGPPWPSYGRLKKRTVPLGPSRGRWLQAPLQRCPAPPAAAPVHATATDQSAEAMQLLAGHSRNTSMPGNP